MVKKMIPSFKKFKELLRIIEKGKYQENPKKHEKYKTLALITFEKSMNPKFSWSQSHAVLKDTWGHCFNSLKFQPNSSDVWELLGDTSYERTETSIALLAYQKALELHPENEEQLRLKILEISKLNKLYVALELGKLPIELQFYLLKCINCGADGVLYPYLDIKKYTVSTGPTKYKITSTITVPLCETCNASPKRNARKNLSYGINGAGVKVGRGKPFSYDLWKEYVILEKFKAGLIDNELFDSLPTL